MTNVRRLLKTRSFHMKRRKNRCERKAKGGVVQNSDLEKKLQLITISNDYNSGNFDECRKKIKNVHFSHTPNQSNTQNTSITYTIKYKDLSNKISITTISITPTQAAKCCNDGGGEFKNTLYWLFCEMLLIRLNGIDYTTTPPDFTNVKYSEEYEKWIVVQ